VKVTGFTFGGGETFEGKEVEKARKFVLVTKQTDLGGVKIGCKKTIGKFNSEQQKNGDEKEGKLTLNYCKGRWTSKTVGRTKKESKTRGRLCGIGKKQSTD